MVAFAEKQIPHRVTVRDRVANYFGLQRLKDAVPKMTGFLEEKYNITIQSNPSIVPVLFYNLFAQRRYYRERFMQYHSDAQFTGNKLPLISRIFLEIDFVKLVLLSSFVFVGMHTHEGRMEFSWWSLALSTDNKKRQTWIHEMMHNLQRGSKLKFSKYSSTDRLEMLALCAASEGMAMEAERTYEQTIESKKFTFTDKFKALVGYAFSMICSPVRTTLRLLGMRKKYKEMTPEQRIDFIEKHRILADIVFNPYRDGRIFVKAVTEEFGAPVAFTTFLDYPPAILEQIYTPSRYIDFVRAEMARNQSDPNISATCSVVLNLHAVNG